jgi:hypothetical protein
MCTHRQISLGISNQGNEVGGACGEHEKGEDIVKGFGLKSRRKEASRKIEA